MVARPGAAAWGSAHGACVRGSCPRLCRPPRSQSSPTTWNRNIPEGPSPLRSAGPATLPPAAHSNADARRVAGAHGSGRSRATPVVVDGMPFEADCASRKTMSTSRIKITCALGARSTRFGHGESGQTYLPVSSSDRRTEPSWFAGGACASSARSPGPLKPRRLPFQ